MHLLRFDGDDFISLVNFDSPNLPRYVILSHTWGSDDEELNYSELKSAVGVYTGRTLEDGRVVHRLVKGANLDRLTRRREIKRIKEKVGYNKIQFCGRQAAKDNLEYFWVDSCCIDKESSAELSEAINSMFKWYKGAVKCYVYLQDVSISSNQSADSSPQALKAVPSIVWAERTQKSRWFTRGWTLQELLAPKVVEFFSKEGIDIGKKEGMSSMLSTITSIPEEALQGTPLSEFTVEERFSWIAPRRTKREEDKAYAMFGIFDVHMPPIYGEGEDGAMRRLRKEIKYKEVEKTLLQSLRFDQIGSRQTTIKDAHNETCQWLLNTREYLNWLNPDTLEQHQGFLWIKGIPGAGKSTIMKFAHGELSQEQFRIRNSKRKTLIPDHDRQTTRRMSDSMRNSTHESIDDTVIIAFFFNARGTVLEKSTEGLYRSLLVQLLERRAYLESIINLLPFATTELGDNYPWNIGILQQLLKEVMIRVKSHVICFIDALDECGEQQIRDMVSFLRQTSDRARKAGIAFRVCFASRHYPHISIDMGIELILERQEGHDKDIAEYLNAELRICNSSTSQLIRHEIRRKASGVFMWVVLVVGILNKTFDRGQIYALQRKLSEIPADLNTLFRDMVTRNPESKAQLVLCVRWLLFAIRPLSPKECYFALLFALEPSECDWGEEDVPDYALERFILDSSQGLAHVTPWSRIDEREKASPLEPYDWNRILPPSRQVVQFIHESVRDFLLDYGGFRLIEPNSKEDFHCQSHQQLTHYCLQYMKSAVLLDEPIPAVQWRPKSRMETSFSVTSLNNYPFLEYSVLHVLDHAKEAGISGGKIVRTVSHFRTDVGRRRSCKVNITFVHLHHTEDPEDEQLQEQTFPAYYALLAVKESAILGIAHVTSHDGEFLRIFVENADRPSFEADWRFRIHRGGHRHLISFMAECATVEMMTALLRSGCFEVNVLDPGGKTPLDYALKRGDGAIIELLHQAGAVETRACRPSSR